jgi:hypothetical protein
MQESEMILDEFPQEIAKKTLLLVGGKRLGPADESVKTSLEGVTDLDRLVRMILQAVTAANWQEILNTP